jgi:hypothetical protein
VRTQWLVKNIEIIYLSVLILFLSTGIHHLTSHTAAEFHMKAGQIAYSTAPKDHPGADHCNVCFASQLLGQCLIPVLENPFVAESCSVQMPFCPESKGFLGPGCAGNRGPPSAAVIA